MAAGRFEDDLLSVGSALATEASRRQAGINVVLCEHCESFVQLESSRVRGRSEVRRRCSLEFFAADSAICRFALIAGFALLPLPKALQLLCICDTRHCD